MIPRFIDPYTATPVARARLYAAMRNVRVNRWIRQSGYRISIEDKTAYFETVSQQSHEQALNLAIQSLAFVEGLLRANDTLQIQMGMSQVRYNINDTIRQADNILRIRLAQELLKTSGLTQTIKNEILYRITARLLPIRDINQLDLHDHMETTRPVEGKTNGKTPPPRSTVRRRPRPLQQGDTPFF